MKVTIGETEFELPFRYDAVTGYIVDAMGVRFCCVTIYFPTTGDDIAKSRVVAESLNEKYAGWIAVSEKLPTDEEYYLWQREDGAYEIARRSSNSAEYLITPDLLARIVSRFVAWRPLPAPYEGGGE